MDFILILSLHFFANNSKISSHGKPNFNLYSLKCIPRSDIFCAARARDTDIFPYTFFENIILMKVMLFSYYIKGLIYKEMAFVDTELPVFKIFGCNEPKFNNF